MTKLNNIHPGEVLQELLGELNISQTKCSEDIGVPVARINRIINRRRQVSPNTALRLGKYFNTTASFWLNLQTAYDLEEAEQKLVDVISKIKPIRYTL
jgi:antitoxin HigA-1